jgi:hypothetical protein
MRRRTPRKERQHAIGVLKGGLPAGGPGKMFGIPMEDFDRDELLVVIQWLGTRMNREREANRNNLSFLADLAGRASGA